MPAKALMLQGTGSDVGKSVLVAGLCRAFKKRGLTVRPFKPQNMSNNAAVTQDGGEIGRAQWLQALACGVEPSVHMNPVLLKPETDTGAQLIVHGKRIGRAESGYYREHKAELLKAVIDSFTLMKSDADIVLVEGAGSASEVNLRASDIANMGFAVPTQTPVVLVGDINRGGVIASLVGTHAVLEPPERALVTGTIINQFRGDVSLFDGGLVAIKHHTGWPNFGVVPFLRSFRQLPAEDAVVLDAGGWQASQKKIIAVPLLPRIANFDDLDPFRDDGDFDLVFCPPGTALPQAASLIVIPGSKATIADLQFLKAEGWDTDIYAHVRAGKPVLGLCGGYQMLGRTVKDRLGVEGHAGVEPGLGLLDIETVIEPHKNVGLTTAVTPKGDISVEGYEIHAGSTTLGADATPYLVRGETVIGAVSQDGLVIGAYLHGLFNDGAFREYFLSETGLAGGGRKNHLGRIDESLDKVAIDLKTYLDIDALFAAAR